jgi:outer membrane immunogenic protein
MSHFSRLIALSVCVITLALSCHDASAGLPQFRPGSGANSASAESWVAGAHAGYNWQQGAAVFGFATDLQATQLNSSMNGGLVYPPGFGPILASDFAATTGKVDWYGTVRGVLGYANGPWMIYGTAGLAYGQVSLASRYSTAGVTLTSLVSEVNTGWVAGVGFEYLLQPNLSLGLLYQYVDLGGLNFAASSPAPALVMLTQSANTTGRFQTLMASLSWRFAPAGSAAPWTGGYAGINGGGAWGNSANATYTGSTLFPSDARLKRDIALVGRRSDGLGVYAYKYLWSDAVYIGVLAQEVALIHPGAVVRDDLTGYLSVDYGLLNRL